LTKERQTNGLPALWGHNILPSRFAIKSLLINMLACHPDPESIDSKRLNQIAPPTNSLKANINILYLSPLEGIF
jgi:hypothetical protein